MATSLNPRNIGIKYGLLAGAGIIIYFFILRATGLLDVSGLWAVNILILFIFLYLAYNEVRHRVHRDRISYLPGLGIGLAGSIACALLYGAFLLIYGGMDETTKTELRKVIPLEPTLGGFQPSGMFFAILGIAEVMVGGVISSFILMQRFKRNHIAEINKTV